MGSAALEPPAGEVGGRGAGRQGDGSGQRLEWGGGIIGAGKGTVATVGTGESHSLGKGLSVARLGRVWASFAAGDGIGQERHDMGCGEVRVRVGSG